MKKIGRNQRKEVVWISGFEDFVGNKKILMQTDSWFKNKYSRQIVIEGPTGNGKTFLVEIFAEKYGYLFQRIDPYDITKKEDYNNILKTLSLMPIESDKK